MEAHQNKSWFSRNWGWVLGGGCLTLIIVAMIGVGAVFFGVSKAFTSSEPYQYAIEKTLNNEKVISILGEPIEEGFMNGNISFKNNTGEADFSIPISGSKGSGRIVILATKTSDTWAYEKLFIQFEGTEADINLLENSVETINE